MSQTWSSNPLDPAPKSCLRYCFEFILSILRRKCPHFWCSSLLCHPRRAAVKIREHSTKASAMTQINSAITVVMAVTSTTSHGTEMAQSTAKATPSGASGDGSDLSGTSSGSQGSSGKPSTGNAGSGGSTKSGSPQASTCTGAIAGGVVGALVGGALIAFLITFLIMSRRRKKHYRRRSLSGSEKTVRRPLSASEGPAAPPVVDPRYAWELHLPQAADNPTLQQKVNGLYDRLELHIENFYSDSPHMAAGQTVSDVDWNRMAQQLQTPYLPMAAGALLQQSRARTIVMKHCLVYMVIAGVDPRASPLFPLLPREMTEVVQAVARGDKTKPGMFSCRLLLRTHRFVLSGRRIYQYRSDKGFSDQPSTRPLFGTPNSQRTSYLQSLQHYLTSSRFATNSSPRPWIRSALLSLLGPRTQRPCRCGWTI